MIRKKISNLPEEVPHHSINSIFTPTLFTILLPLLISMPLILISGCCKKKIPVTPSEMTTGESAEIPPTAIQALNSMVARDCSCLPTLTADLELRYTSPLKNEAVNGYLQFSQPANYKFSITNPLGQPIWVLAGNNKSFQLLDIMHKSYTSGSVLSYTVRNHLPVFLAEGNWGEWLTGRNFIDSERIIRVDNDSNGRGIWFTLPTTTAHAPYTQLLLDSEMKTLLERIFLDQNGKKLAVIRYQRESPPSESDQCHQPEYIHISGLGYGSTIELRFSQVEFSQGLKTYTLPRPEKGYSIQFRP